MSLRSIRGMAHHVLRETSVVSQIVHSATSFVLMAGMARFAPPEVFALSSAFFLLLTLFSSLNIYLFSAAWLRSVDGHRDELNALGFLLAVGFAVAFGVIWYGYRTFAFGNMSLAEVPLTMVAAFLYVYLLSRRRQLLLDAHFLTSTLMDSIRGIVMACLAALVWWLGVTISFSMFLGIFVAGHLFALLPSWASAERRWNPRSGLHPLMRMLRGDWLGVGAGWVNVLFSQAATLLAPLLIGTHQYATLRAYELFAFPVMFMAQVLDPLQIREYRDQHARGSRLPTWMLLRPALIMCLPFAAVCVLAWVSPTARDAVLHLIAPPYRDAFFLLVWVLAVATLLSLNAPVRWYLTVTGSGGALLRGSAVGIPVSLAVLWWLSQRSPTAETVLMAKLAYEACLLVAGSLAIIKLRREKASP